MRIHSSRVDGETLILDVTIDLPLPPISINMSLDLCKHCGAAKNAKDDAGNVICPYDQFHDVDEDEHEVPTVKAPLCDCFKTCGPGLHETWCKVDRVLNES